MTIRDYLNSNKTIVSYCLKKALSIAHEYEMTIDDFYDTELTEDMIEAISYLYITYEDVYDPKDTIKIINKADVEELEEKIAVR